MDTEHIIALVVVLFVLSFIAYGAWWWKNDTVLLTATAATAVTTGTTTVYTFTGTLPTPKTGQTAMTSAAVTALANKTLRINIAALKGSASGTIGTAVLGSDNKTVTFTMAANFALATVPTAAIAVVATDTLRVLMKY